MANTFYRKTLSNIGLIANTVGSYTVGGSTTSVVLGLTVLQTNDNVKIVSDTVNSVDAIMSIMEIT